ncbi:MAG: uroporphyrinogen decarboxylase family protein [Candidatus Lokiarchaeia archaeon]
MSWRDKIIDKEIDFLAEKIRLKAESEEMTPLMRFASVVLGTPPDRMPIFAASTEWGAHWLGYQLNKDFAYDYKKWVHAALAITDRSSTDICAPMYDIYNIGPDAMGAEVIFPEDAIPEIRKPGVKTPEDLENLKIPDPHKDGRMPLVLEACKLVREKIGDIVPILATVNAPFSWAANLRGIYDYLADLKRNPKFAKDLLEIVTEAVIGYVKALVDLGFMPVLIADATATTYLLSPKQIEDYGVWSYRKIEEALGKDAFVGSLYTDFETQAKIVKMGVPNFLGITNYCYCDGTGTEPLKEEDILEQKRIAKELGVPNVTFLWGQWLMVHSPREIDEEVKRVFKLAGPDWPFMVGAWYIPLGTPVENLDALVRAIKKYGKFPL